jgi:hypothetical protein
MLSCSWLQIAEGLEMTTAKQDRPAVDTGGGAYVGRDQLISVTQSRQGASLEELLELLARRS